MNRTEEFKKLIERISVESNIPIPEGYTYRYAPFECWKCNKEMLVFTWTEPLISGSINIPPDPRPITLKERYTSTSNQTYWANVCPQCDSVQGDFFVKNEPDSPLFVIQEVVDDKDAFHKDMEEMADYFYETLV